MHTQLKNFAYCLIIHFLSQSAYAAEKDDKPFAEQHVILQVSDADPAAENNPNHSRFNSLMDNGVKFYVCLNTIETIHRKTGKRPVLLDSILGVQNGPDLIRHLYRTGGCLSLISQDTPNSIGLKH